MLMEVCLWVRQASAFGNGVVSILWLWSMLSFLEARFCYYGDEPAIRSVEEGFIRVVWVVCDFVRSCGYGV